MKYAIVLANLGGPRNLVEVQSFVHSWVTDHDVVCSSFPYYVEQVLLRCIARKRGETYTTVYQEWGGSSPVYYDTERIAEAIRRELAYPVLTFHRYLPNTHRYALELIEKTAADEVIVFPFFPQFSYTTTGSIARLFAGQLSASKNAAMRWVRSYASHPSFIAVYRESILSFLEEQKISLEEVFLVFAVHSVRQKIIDRGDPYILECENGCSKLLESLGCRGLLCYYPTIGCRSKRVPSLFQIAKDIGQQIQGERYVLFVLGDQISDQPETVLTIDKEVMPLIESQGLQPLRLPALSHSPQWVSFMLEILQDFVPTTTQMLVRH